RFVGDLRISGRDGTAQRHPADARYRLRARDGPGVAAAYRGSPDHGDSHLVIQRAVPRRMEAHRRAGPRPLHRNDAAQKRPLPPLRRRRLLERSDGRIDGAAAADSGTNRRRGSEIAMGSRRRYLAGGSMRAPDDRAYDRHPPRTRLAGTASFPGLVRSHQSAPVIRKGVLSGSARRVELAEDGIDRFREQVDQFFHVAKLFEVENSIFDPSAARTVYNIFRQRPELRDDLISGKRRQDSARRRLEELFDGAVRKADAYACRAEAAGPFFVEFRIVMRFDLRDKRPNIILRDPPRRELRHHRSAIQDSHGDRIADVHLRTDGLERALNLPPAVMVGGIGHVDVDMSDLFGSQGPFRGDLEQRIEGGVERAHRGIGFDDDALRFPGGAETRRDPARIGCMAFAEDGEKAAIVTLEDALDAGVAG